MIENAAIQGDYFLDRLRELSSSHIKEVRGKGLLIGVELFEKAGGARRFSEALLKKGLLCKETHHNILRLAPPLVIQRKEIDWAMERIEQVLNSI
jgi:ornithine--oxo-acid transaminase